MICHSKMKNRIYRWVSHPSAPGPAQYFYDVGILADGSLHNPRGYPPDIVREAVEAANARRDARRSEAAKRAAKTRALRREKRVTEAAKRILAGEGIGESMHCEICGKALSDPESIKRGIGSECWQDVLTAISAWKQL